MTYDIHITHITVVHDYTSTTYTNVRDGVR